MNSQVLFEDYSWNECPFSSFDITKHKVMWCDVVDCPCKLETCIAALDYARWIHSEEAKETIER